MEKKKNIGIMAALGILSISGMGMGSTVLTPAMNVLGEHFAGKNVSFAMTMGTLGVVLGSFIGGMIAGKNNNSKESCDIRKYCMSDSWMLTGCI